jgi:hypothetical protein
MRHPELLVYEGDGRLAGLVRGLAEKQSWTLREMRDTDACLRVLLRGGPAVLVLKVGRDLVREFTLLEQAAWLCPQSPAVLVGETDDGVLTALAWDLGARYVLFPPQPRHQLPDIVASLMAAAAPAAAKGGPD